MTKIELIRFVEEINLTKKGLSDIIRISKKYNIPFLELDDAIETDTESVWEIPNLGHLYQCKDCKSMEFVEFGNKKLHVES